MKKQITKFQWSFIQVALWGYATTTMTITCIDLLFKSVTNTTYTRVNLAQDAGTIEMAAIFLFFLLILFQYKKYTWNIWRIIGFGYSLFFFGYTLFSEFSPHNTPLHTYSTATHIATILFLLPITVYLFVVGKDMLEGSLKRLL